VDDLKKMIVSMGLAPIAAEALEEFYRNSISLQKLEDSKIKLQQAAHGLEEAIKPMPMPLKSNRASRRRQKFGKKRI